MGTISSKHDEEDPAIEAFVEMTLANRSLNMSCLPDKYERRLYSKITRYAIDAIRNILSTVEFRFLHHRLTFNVEPLQDSYV